MNVEVLPSAEAVARRASVVADDARATAAAARPVRRDGQRRPHPLADAAGLAGEDLAWEKMHILQVDECAAPLGDPGRNVPHLRGSLLADALLRLEQPLPVPVEEEDLEAAAACYARTSGDIARARRC
ncbi:MAG TPA: 6-phosphogluconolactonase [Gemmataceae bacterium]